eukprot:TRINITY_DN11777_c0_g1_i1.p1 TRINITY_DN11777_c0_g1~~TRINITY_DN11777_c0_g1_i1.p1  ORF type:complete len:389 (-),score=96.83 TRINITY_DN11777_c0_g1_i1:66-1232(-)
MAEGEEQIVTPWDVQATDDDGIDYSRLIREFGTTEIDEELIARVEALSGQPAHPWLKRGLFFSHRDVNKILDMVEEGIGFYLYTGRGPSSESLHLGHMVPFVFTLYLQKAFNVPLVIQLTDDEKFLWKDIPLEQTHKLAFDNAKDIIALGYDPEKTFIFTDHDYVGTMYPTIVRIQKCVTANQARGIFGFSMSDNIGKWAFPAIQAAPSFPSSFPEVLGGRNMPCLIPCAIDQDPYFRMTRDVAPRLGFHKPAVIHSRFFPALQGPKSKMSASVNTSAIFMTDTYKQIRKKVMKHAFSGGKATKEEHRALGGDPSIDVAYQYLTVFEFDDDKLKATHDAFKSGEMLSGEIKQVMVDCVWEFIQKHQQSRTEVTDELLESFFEVRSRVD